MPIIGIEEIKMNKIDKYRICKNLDNRFKIQRFKTISIFGIVLYQRWVDGCFDNTLIHSGSLSIFGNYQEAQKQIQIFIDKETKRTKNNGKEWIPVINESSKPTPEN